MWGGHRYEPVLAKAPRVRTYFFSFKVVDNRCVNKQEVLIQGVINQYFCYRGGSAPHGAKVGDFKSMPYIMLTKSVASPFLFRMNYVSMCKINRRVQYSLNVPSNAVLCFSLLYLSFICSFSLIILSFTFPPWNVLTAP